MLMGFKKAGEQGKRALKDYLNKGGDFVEVVFDAQETLHQIQEALESDAPELWWDPTGATDPSRIAEISEGQVDFQKKKFSGLSMSM